MRLVFLLIYTGWTLTHMFSSKYLWDQPINNTLFASEHGHNHPGSKWGFTHECWKGFSCRGKYENIYLKTSCCCCQISSCLFLSSWYISVSSAWKENPVSFLCPFSLFDVFSNLMFVTNSASLRVNVVSKEVELDCDERADLLSMSSVRCCYNFCLLLLCNCDTVES